MLVHICCSVDSHFFLQKLKSAYPDEELTAFFYDPNIHPYSEYQLRLFDVQRSCNMLGVKLIEGEYDYEGWLNSVKGYENEPEKGKRCGICFDFRVERSFIEAKKIGEKKVTTTLLTSPKKSIEQLREVGDKLAKKYNLEFISPDFRKNGGTQEQFLLAKEDKLYHQNYCGCMYALNLQRESQDRVASELFSPINRQVLPASIEEKMENYTKRVSLEESNKKYDFVRSDFLNYRILQSYLKISKKIRPSYALNYSILRRKKTKLRVEKEISDIFYANRDSVKFIELKEFNNRLKTSYKDIKELYFNPPSFEKEVDLRYHIEKTPHSTSPIIIVEKVDFESFELYIDAVTFNDVRENLVIF